MIKRKLIQVVGMAYELSTKTKADVFVEYYPHVSYISCQIYKNGWVEDAEPDKELNVKMTVKNLDEIIELFQIIKQELEV